MEGQFIQVTNGRHPVFDYTSPGGSTGCPVYIGWTDALDMQTSAPIWRIKKVIYDASGNRLYDLWADGDTFFDNVWDDRVSLTYR